MRMRLRIGQRQRRTPGTADDHPACDAKFLADRFNIRDQMRQAIVFAAALGAASTGAALIEQDGVEAFGIKQPPMVGLAAASDSACLKICSCRGDSVQAGSVLPALPVSAKAWQRQPPKSISLNSQLRHGSGIQPVPR